MNKIKRSTKNIKYKKFHIFAYLKSKAGKYNIALLELKENNCNTEVQSEPSQTSKTELSAKILNDIQLLILFGKSSDLDVRTGSEYAFVTNTKKLFTCSIV